ncbi:hypothetical protein H4R18_003223 [Coemansia javaensis]|uniref:Uncharacterized protein n=1 Tax=Coemansia javaensis TaxID=2761396 RepID=A0A9W8H7M0_9FUNG|nr:hypothetical protein H4R18_003223 [Coemansia javaensis]
MRFQDLPDDVLILLARLVLETSDKKEASFKANLPLLGVFRRWRQLVLPIVFREAYIYYGGSKVDMVASMRDLESGTEPEAARLSTNMGLIVSSRCAHVVRAVHIYVFYIVSPLVGLSATVQFMRAAAEKWERVDTLEVSINSGVWSHGHESGVDSYKNNAVIALTQVMPAVRQLGLSGANNIPVVRRIYGDIAALYSDQLWAIDVDHTIYMSQDYVFKQLRRATLRYSSWYSSLIPRINPAELVSLELLGWPSAHSWAAFSADGNGESADIEFPKLERLRASYRKTFMAEGVVSQVVGEGQGRLAFPRLRELDVDCSQSTCPLLARAVLPAQMDRLSIDMTPSVLVSAPEMIVPLTEHIRVCIGDECGRDGRARGSAALAVANRMLEGAPGMRTTELCIAEDSLDVRSGTISCVSLTRLEVCPEISAAIALELIRSLPSLTDLTLKNVPMDSTQDVPTPEPEDGRPARPFDTRIRTLSLGVYERVWNSTLSVSFVEYLLLRIRTLVRLSAPNVPEDPVVEFVGRHFRRYPHLADIELDLDPDYSPDQLRYDPRFWP